MDLRPLLVGALAVAALAGIALAAEGQQETFLKPADLESGFAERDIVSGSLVALTALLVAAALTAAAGVLARCRWQERLLPLVVLFLGTYIVIVLIQTGMFNYQAIDVARYAEFSISPIFANQPAAPSVFIGPLAVLMAAALGMQAAGRRLMGRSQRLEGPRHALLSFLACLTLATPWLIILMCGSIRVLVAMPGAQPAALGYFLVLPLSALAAAGLLAVGSIKAWHLGQFARNGRLAPVAREAWEAMRRAELAAAAVLAALAVLAAILPAVPHPIFEAGRVFGLTARTHTQAQALLLVLLVPWLMMHRPALRVMAEADDHSRTLELGVHPLVLGYWVAATAALAGAVLATWLLEGALWPWLLCALPIAVFALTALQPQDGLLPALLAAAVLWGVGNTIIGSFQLTTNSQLRFDTNPGLLALWRALAITLVAWAVARAARARTAAIPRRLAWPLTTGLAAGVGFIVFFEFSFVAWIIRDGGAEWVGIGTMVASLDGSVRGVLHTLSGAAAFLGGLAVSRLERPEWFRGGKGDAVALPALPNAG